MSVKCEHYRKELDDVRSRCVSESDDSTIRTYLEEELRVILETPELGGDVDVDQKAVDLMKEIYEMLGLVVEELPDCIPDPEGGYMTP